MMATNNTPPSSSKAWPPPQPQTMKADARPPRVRQTFQCNEDLLRAFEKRATELECSVDWLIAEAMKRLLEAGPRAAPPPPPPPPEPKQRKATTLPPIPRLPPPPPPKMTPIVLITNGIRQDVDRDSFVIGRSAREAHLVLRDPGVSRQHAIIEKHGAAYVIVDMASTNGVMVNGTRVSRAILRAGDRIEIGPFVVIVDRGMRSSRNSRLDA